MACCYPEKWSPPSAKPAGPAQQQPPRHLRRIVHHAAPGTDEAFRPSKLADVRATGGFAGEPRLEFRKGAGIVSARLGKVGVIHASMLRVVAGCVKGIPTSTDFPLPDKRSFSV